jgi:hypothetical protein
MIFMTNCDVTDRDEYGKTIHPIISKGTEVEFVKTIEGWVTETKLLVIRYNDFEYIVRASDISVIERDHKIFRGDVLFEWLKLLNEPISTDLILEDFQKTFDFEIMEVHGNEYHS